MKSNKLLLTLFSSTLLSCGSSPTLFALTESQVRALNYSLATVPVLELAPKTADLVRTARAAERVPVAEELVRIVAERKPSLITTVVASITQAAPETAAAVVAVAVERCPEQAADIARAAATASPTAADRIAAAAAQRAPKAARQISRMTIAASPAQADRILELVISAVPHAKAEIENDRTLNVLGVLARESRASASRDVSGKTGSRPLPNFVGTPTPTTSVTQQTRSAAVQSAIQQLQSLESGTAISSKSLQSDITIATINALNVIGRETSITKTEKDSIINATMATVSSVVGTSSVDQTVRADVIKTTALVVATIVSDPGLSDAVKKDYANFAADAVKTIVATVVAASQPTNLPTAIAATASEVSRVIESVRNKTPDEAQAGLTKAQEKVNEIKKSYGSP